MSACPLPWLLLRIAGLTDLFIYPSLHSVRNNSETRAPVTVQNYLGAMKRLFREAAPAIFVEGAHVAVDNRPHPVVDTGGVATPLPLATTEQLQSFLHRYQDVLTVTAHALPGWARVRAVVALRQLMAFAGGAKNGSGRGQQAHAPPPLPPASKWAPQGERAERTKGRPPRDLWGRLVSPELEEQFGNFQR